MSVNNSIFLCKVAVVSEVYCSGRELIPDLCAAAEKARLPVLSLVLGKQKI